MHWCYKLILEKLILPMSIFSSCLYGDFKICFKILTFSPWKSCAAFIRLISRCIAFVVAYCLFYFQIDYYSDRKYYWFYVYWFYTWPFCKNSPISFPLLYHPSVLFLVVCKWWILSAFVSFKKCFTWYFFRSLTHCFNSYFPSIFPLLLKKFKFIYLFNWRISALQNCVGFCLTSTWISLRDTLSCPSWNSLPTPPL